MSLPVVIRRDQPHIFESVLIGETVVLFLHIKFEVSERKMQGYVALIMDLPSASSFGWSPRRVPEYLPRGSSITCRRSLKGIVVGVLTGRQNHAPHIAAGKALVRNKARLISDGSDLPVHFTFSLLSCGA